MAKETDWWTEFFPVFRPVFDSIAPRETSAIVKYLVKKLELKKGSRFLDCACGIGRIAIPLSKAGVRVTGVDITGQYLDELAAKSKRLRLKINLVNSDMRRIKFDRQFDAAGNIGTSLGYFDRDSDNELVLKRMCRALKPGGKFLLHIASRDWVLRNYTTFNISEIGNIKVLNKRHFDLARSQNIAEWTFLKDGREKVVRSVLRMYSFHELIIMIRRAGFVNIEGFGSTRDDPIDLNSRMMFVIGVKPG